MIPYGLPMFSLKAFENEKSKRAKNGRGLLILKGKASKQTSKNSPKISPNKKTMLEGKAQQTAQKKIPKTTAKEPEQTKKQPPPSPKIIRKRKEPIIQIGLSFLRVPFWYMFPY